MCVARENSGTSDAENRLISVTPLTPQDGDLKTEYAYDYMSRRVQKNIYEWQIDHWSLLTEHRFVYDDWNLIREETTEGSQTTAEYYVWGLDLSGTLQGAGGIGGLLTKTNSLTSKTYLYTFDANGNVGQLVDAADGSIAAHYEYDPFGKLLATTGSEADNNVFRFSTKHYDVETGLYNYGYRDYSSKLARWTSRDPLEEEGGLNLYAFVENDPINFIDILGLVLITWKRDGYACVCGKKDAGVTDLFSMDEPTKAKIAERFGLTVQELNAFKQNSSLSKIGAHEELPADSKVWVVLTPTGDTQLLARLAYSEGTSGNADDKYAVASVVLNRIAHKKKYPRVSPYESTIQSVIYQKTPGGANEFEALTISKWSNSANPARLTVIDEIMDWNLSAKGAEKATKVGPMSDLRGATVFHSTSKYGDEKKIIPGQVATKYWNIQYITQFGRHYYFVITPKSKP